MNGRRAKNGNLCFFSSPACYVLHTASTTVFFKQLRNIYSLAKRLFCCLFLGFHGLWMNGKALFCELRKFRLYFINIIKRYFVLHGRMANMESPCEMAQEKVYCELSDCIVGDVAVQPIFSGQSCFHHCLCLPSRCLLPHPTLKSHKINNCRMANHFQQCRSESSAGVWICICQSGIGKDKFWGISLCLQLCGFLRLQFFYFNLKRRWAQRYAQQRSRETFPLQ